MHRSGLIGLIAVVSVGATPLSAAEVTPIAPFTGSHSEGFESFGWGVVPPGDHAILGGTATLAPEGDPFASFWCYSHPETDFAWSLGDGIAAQLQDGLRGMALDGEESDVAVVEFDGLVSAFGGWWAVAIDAPWIDVRFFDQGGELFTSAVIEYDAFAMDGALAWHGWSSSRAISRVEIQGSSVAFDELQVVAIVPAPGAAALAGLALLAVRGRRRAAIG